MEKSWQYEQYEKINFLEKYDLSLIFKKWKPIINNKKVGGEIYDLVKEKISIFSEIYLEVDSLRPEQQAGIYPTMSNMSLSPMVERYKPNGWIEPQQALDNILDRVLEYFNSGAEINLEIVKEYYNIITKKKTYLLKDDNGERVILDFELEEERKQKVFEIIDDEILYILEPSERKRLLRKKKLFRIIGGGLDIE